MRGLIDLYVDNINWARRNIGSLNRYRESLRLTSTDIFRSALVDNQFLQREAHRDGSLADAVFCAIYQHLCGGVRNELCSGLLLSVYETRQSPGKCFRTLLG